MNVQAPRPIASGDRCAGFDCGELSLNSYLEERALANHASGAARCYVCLDDAGRVIGYYTLSAIAIERARLPGRARPNSPDPVPAVLLGRLAVDRSHRGQGVGRGLLRDAIGSTLVAAQRIGVRLLIVHAVDESAADWYAQFGFRPSPTDGRHLYLLLADARSSLGG